MKLIHYLYLVPLALLTACNSSGDEAGSPVNEHINGEIYLTAGIVEENVNTMTRAGAEDNHSKHLTLTADTKLALQVSGTWKGHNSEDIVKTTTASIGEVTGADNKHNKVIFSQEEVLYWDDYGSADPNNSIGRTLGLTIYGATINGKTTAPIVSNWTALNWTLAADQTASGETPADKDLLISNNVKSSTEDGTYRFDHRESGKLLEFTHAMSKITVNLKAGTGFAGGNFASPPEVKLTSNEANETAQTEWAYTTGTVNVTTGAVTVDNQVGPAVITMFQTATATEGYNVTKEALVMPGSEFGSDAAIIARIKADGNIYYVTAEKIRAAIKNNSIFDGALPTAPGRNYIINVTINKTDIVVTATVKDWTDVTAAEVSPVINVSASWGEAGSTMGDGSFSFYRSLNMDGGYSANKTLVDTKYYPEESYVTKSSDTWTMTPTLYWPNHNTHYQFRGVWPRTESDGGPRVEDGSNNTVGCQVIKVQNVAYAAGTFPSDLQIARPEVATDATCTNNEPGHTKTNLWTGGICATEGTINLNFKYMMSQVEVNLSTTDTSDPDYLGDAVELTNAVVDIINVYSTGDVKLGDRSVVPTGSTGSYTLNTVSGEGNANKRRSAIVPQTLTYSTPQASTNVRFRITITNADTTTDVYYADVEPILKSDNSGKVAPNGAWESGYHYVYNLMLSKTKVKVTATMANWTTVNASENVWF